ncbi:MAG: hypothetical protein JWR21_2512 [Herminiimonas sp.]|nr:hypothetical protein [Herminiimonas sp.]
MSWGKLHKEIEPYTTELDFNGQDPMASVH